MASEARAMLDALMGSDRNADIPASGQNNLQRKKKSCYDRDICPFYCAWGIDVFELFTNTKSDLGPNPNAVQDDAREEFLSLPDHEKDRLGYEFMLYRKLSDLVRGCDRIVNRNKEKLRVEIVKAAKARGAAGRTIDPATDISEEMILEAAEIIGDLELQEEEVSDMVVKLMASKQTWKTLWDELQVLENGDFSASDSVSEQEQGTEKNEAQGGAEEKSQNENGNADTSTDVDATNDENTSVSDSNTNEKNIIEQKETTNKDEITNEENVNDKDKDKKENDPTQSEEDKATKIKEIKSKLYKISADQQKIISSLSVITTQKIVPLRDSLQNINKQLYYVKTDTSSDKTVCEVSGNFMSSRDAEERIAAHYAGKQYVGWKMVRDKVRELHKKYAHGRPGGGPPGGSYGGGPRHGGGGGYGGPPPGHGGGGYGHGYGNGYGHGQGGHGYGHHRGPPMGGGGRGGFGGPPPPGYGGPPPSYSRRDRRNRSRSRERDGSSSRSRHHRRRSPSPPRWKRDRGYDGRR